jgi:hypothetical protein
MSEEQVLTALASDHDPGIAAAAKRSRVSFDRGATSAWDVSVIDTEFARGSGESMMEHWQKIDGRDQRRFLFFHEGALYKIFIQVSIPQLDESQRSFDAFAKAIADEYGGAVVAVDKSQAFDAFGLVLEDPRRSSAVAEVRSRSSAAPSHATYGTGQVFFEEDLSKTEEGDLVPAWGKEATALGSSVRFLGTQKPGLHRITRSIDFPRDWSLELTVVNHAADGARGDEWALPIAFVDENGDSMVVDLKLNDWIHGYRWIVELSGVAAVEVPSSPGTGMTLRVVFKAGQVKVFIDDNFLASLVVGDRFAAFKRLALTVRGGSLTDEAIGYSGIRLEDMTPASE